MTKKQIQNRVKVLREEIVGILKGEKNLVYTGTDDDFGDRVSHLYGGLGDVLDAMDDILDTE